MSRPYIPPVIAITTNSAQYTAACQLRYATFFAAQNHPFSIIFDRYEQRSEHWGIIGDDEQVWAYTRLTQISTICVSVSQVAVQPHYQRQGLGQHLMQKMEARAAQLGVQHIILYARDNAIPFYQKLGYIGEGDLFPSSKTGVLHLQMKKFVLS